MLAQVLLEWQVGVAREQDVESGGDRGAEEFAVRLALPAELRDMLRDVWRQVARQADGQILVDEDAH